MDDVSAGRRGDDDLRRLGEVPRRGRSADGDCRQGVRLGLVARLGGEGDVSARREGRHRGVVRAHSPQQPREHGCAAAAVQGGRERGVPEAHRYRGIQPCRRGCVAEAARRAARAADVRNVVAGARSVIVTGTIYNAVGRTLSGSPGERDSARPTDAVIARYALGDDYHDVLKARLDALLAWMRAESGEPFDARAYVDTGPVQERVYAQYAGLGWIGKNTCLINAEHGSFLFLAEIITTLALEPDTQALEQCGSCRRCLDACPTGALVDAGVLAST